MTPDLYLEYAQLAFASYANLAAGIQGPDYNAALEDAGMAEKQAQRFAESWSVVDQFGDSTGVSATIFQRGTELYLAIRGTEPEAGDILADGLLALGVSAKLNPQFESLKSQIDGVWRKEGGPLFGKDFSVSGHSLGGYLAVAVKESYPDSVTEAYIYNAPGTGGLVGNIADLVSGIFSETAPGANGVWNIKASEGLTIAAGIGSQPSSDIPVQIEDGGLGFANHSIIRLTDALAIQSLYFELDPSLTDAQLNALVDASGNPTNRTLESALDALRTLFLGSAAVANKPTTTDARAVFYTNFYELKDRVAYQQLAAASNAEIAVLAGRTASELAGLASSGNDAGLAARYALVALNSFALTGADYSGFNADRQLELYDPQTERNGLTQQYIADRANFLERKLWFSAEDRSPVDPNATYDTDQPFNFANEPDSRLFIDAASGYEIRLGPIFPSTYVYAFGDDRANDFVGQSLEDHLYGGAGTDLLTGGQGNDYLEGGAGLDAYLFKSGDGVDTVLDSDGKGLLLRDGSAVSLGVQQSSDVWALGNTTFTRSGSDLVISFGSGSSDSITLNDFNFAAAQGSGYMGIRLAAATPAYPQNPVRTFIGDKAVWDSDGNPTNGTQPQPDAFGNTILADGQDGRPDIQASDQADLFFGSDANEEERFVTGGGDDAVFTDRPNGQISATGGVDNVDAGDGSDIVVAGAGNDWVEGGTGADLLVGNDGDDTLYAEWSGGGLITIDLAIAQGESGNARAGAGDLLSGDAGNDVLISDAGSDLLAGGLDNDIIVGGAGDDTIYGDVSITDAQRGWTVTRTRTDVGQTANFTVDKTGMTTAGDDAAGGADTIYGGAGADWIFAGAGPDYIEGGAGDDVIFGEAGSDVLLGGDGNDFLEGDSAAVDSAGLSGDDYLSGEAGNDELLGGNGNDVLDGGEGDDRLSGGEGDDTLYGGPGTDILDGGAGKDTYVYNRGDGVDVVTDPDISSDSQYLSVLVLGPGISRDQVKFRLGSLMVDFGAGDAIHFNGFNPDDPLSTPVLGSIQFADGSAMSYQDVLDQGFDIDGTEESDQISGTAVADRIQGFGGDDLILGQAGDDTIFGGAGVDRIFGGDGRDALWGGDASDVIDGEAGDDTVSGDAGDDLLTGGIGNDTMDGGAGDDIINGGDGDDVIAGGDGADVITAGSGNDVVDAGEGDDTVDAGDGGDTLAGGLGADVLIGGAGADVLAGGAGADRLTGGLGADTYLYTLGDGNDVITDQGDIGVVDTLNFGPGIGVADVSLSRNFNGDLVARLADGATMTVQGMYNLTANHVEQVTFDDGTVIDQAALDALPANRVLGGEGADVLVGRLSRRHDRRAGRRRSA